MSFPTLFPELSLAGVGTVESPGLVHGFTCSSSVDVSGFSVVPAVRALCQCPCKVPCHKVYHGSASLDDLA